MSKQTSGTQGDSERSELAGPGNRAGKFFLYSITKLINKALGKGGFFHFRTEELFYNTGT
ncbi:MAG: hypothetical protein IKF90_22550 [Parasporobacterium sp.]|nr:hypothetical protein [Parasporobacterium sp.]